MKIHYRQSEGMMVISIIGRLDSKTTPEFMLCCSGWPVEPMVLDLSGLEYLSSSGLRALLQLRRTFAKTGSPVVLAGSGGIVDKVLRVSGFEQVFSIYAAVPDAVRAVASGGT